ncbi:MAG: phage major capsid protein, partial [Rhodospirillales bacterium]
MTAIRNHRGILAVRAEASDVMAEIRELNAAHADWRDRESAKVKALEANLIEMEQRLAERDLAPRGGARRSPGAALADKLAKDDGWGAVADKRSTKTSIGVGAGTMLDVQANTIRYDSGGLNVTDGQREIVSGMERRRWLRDRIAMIPTTGGAVEFTRELTFTNNAAPQGGNSPFEHEGVAKAESVLTYEQVELKVPTVAHFIKSSRQILGDVPLLRQTLDSRLLYGLEVVLENQILNGTGVGANMSGLTKSGNFTAFTPTSGDTAIDSINRALAALETNEAQPDVVVMHPTDFRAMQRVKASGSGEFLFG